MKKKLITIFSLCAALVISMCSINLKSANAEEEQSASAEEEQIMEFTEGNTYYVSIDYYNEVLVPNKNAGIKTGDYVIRFYSLGEIDYDEYSEKLRSVDFEFDFYSHRGVYCSFKLNELSSAIENKKVWNYSDDSFGTIWKYITVNELPEFEEVNIELGDNLFESICYGYIGSEYDEKICLTDSSPVMTNIMTIETNKDLFVSIKYRLSNEIIDFDNITCSRTKFLLFDENFRVIDSEERSFINYSIREIFEVDSSGHYITFNIVLNNPQTKVPNAKYFTIQPVFVYNILEYGHYFEPATSITDMYASFVESGLIYYKDQLELDVDYTPKTNTVTWDSELVDINSNYLSIKVSETTDFSSFVPYVKVTDSNGDNLEINYGSLYPEELHVQGEKYGYIMKTTNSSGVDEFLLVYLYVVDKTPPVIKGSSEYVIPNKTLLSVETIKDSLIVYDDISSASEITLVTKYDYYTQNYKTPGEYYVCFTATDKEGNNSDYLVKIVVEDREKPKFYDSYNRVSTCSVVYKSLDSVLVMSDVVNTIKAVDEVDGNLEIKIHSDNYTGNGDKLGEYLVVLKAKDKSGNVAYYNVNIIVSDSMASKSILIDEKLIIVEKNIKLSEEDFHNMIKLIGSYNSNTTSYTTINDDIYSSSSKITGDYLVEYTIVTTSGVESDNVFTVRVIDARTSNSIKDEPEKEDGFIVSALKWIWNLILSFFEWIGSLFTK